MSKEILQFVSPSLRLRVVGTAQPITAQYDGWTLREEWVPDQYIRESVPYGEYRFLVERQVSSCDEVNDRFVEGVYLVEDLERVWSYATGMALRSHGFTLFLSRVSPPSGWTTNAREVKRTLQSQTSNLIGEVVEITSTHWRGIEEFPLSALVTAMSSYRQANELVRALIGYHYEGLMSRTDDGPEFLFAKGLEIVREILPGGNDSAKQAALHQDVQQTMTQSLHWLYGIANTRRNTRHPITKRPALALHPEMSGQETLEFLRNADIVIRGVVCDHLGVPFVAVRY